MNRIGDRKEENIRVGYADTQEQKPIFKSVFVWLVGSLEIVILQIVMFDHIKAIVYSDPGTVV
jgi:hypothetical protein